MSSDCTRAVITVEDTGLGIAPDVLPHLFERFRQADSSMARKYKGLGLGLSLVKQITELHGGSVHAESGGEGKGSTFIVEFPRLDASTEFASAAASNAGDCTGVRVLAVDDDPTALGLVARLLEEAGAAVTLCASAEEALAALNAQAFDVLVSDISMPEMDGYALLQEVRALSDPHRASIPAIAVTAFGRAADEQRSLEAGYSAHHSKLVDPVKLCALVWELADGRS